MGRKVTGKHGKARRLFAAAAFLIAMLSGISPSLSIAQQEKPAEEPAVAVAPINGEKTPLRSAVIIPLHEDINPLSGALLKRKFAEAVDSDTDVVILDIHSPGGLVYVTFELMDMIADAKHVETVAFIQKDAISGAALISLACDRIIMLPGARIGDAGEIVMGADGAFRYTEAKSRSVLAQKVRDTAQRTGRPLSLAEKMTDKDMVVFRSVNRDDGSIRYISDKEWDSMPEEETAKWHKGKPVREAGEEMFFTVNGARAVELGFAERTVTSEAELAGVLNVESPIPVMKRTGVDTAILILNSGFVTFLLIVIGLIALVIELGAPGIGIGGLTSILCFGLFFWSRFLGGTAGWLEVTQFVLGIIFIAMEIFVIPGLGVAGVGGVTLMVTSLVMASRRFMVPGNMDDVVGLGMDFLIVLGAFAGFFVALIVLANYIGEIPGLGRLTLKPQMATVNVETQWDEIDSDTAALLPGWQRVNVGDMGVAAGALRPGGKINIEDYSVDVVTEGDFVEHGQKVKVIAKQGSKVVVRSV